ncbi:MAG: DegV family protein [Anaerolineales bacterium]|nr:DegV family protein [Anaerolineales bacterium]
MKIVTDCAADLPVEEIQAMGLTIAPLFIQFPEGEVNSDDITADEFYRRLEAMRPQIPTTAQPSAGIFADIYRKLAEKGEEIFSIHISSGLSGTIESARLGAAQVPEAVIHLVDTMTLSGGERFQVLAAAKGILAGLGKDAILERLNKIRESTEVIYTLETLEYLARGGRIGRVQALAGSLLRIKPIIHVAKHDGKYSTVGRARTIPKALQDIVDYLASQYSSTLPVWVTVLHGQFASPAQALADLLQERLRIAKLEIMRISPVLGVHTGPEIVGVAVVPMHLMD